MGLSCAQETDFKFSFHGFAERGGCTAVNDDGWGIAWYEGTGCRVFLDTIPSSRSPVAELVKSYPIRTLNVIAHVRKSTVGNTSLANVHPFQRELWGRYWTFAHNGDLPGWGSRCKSPAEPLRHRGLQREPTSCIDPW